jgi:hypothetical protein
MIGPESTDTSRERMTPTDPEEIIEIIDQRRAPTSWVKYVALAAVGVAFIVCGYLLLVQFTPRNLAGAMTTPLEKGVTLTGKFLKYVGDFLTTTNTSTRTEVVIGRVTSADKTGPLIVAKQDIALKFTNVDESLLGTSTADARVRATAYYYVPLLGSEAVWKIETREKDGVRVCVVHAPALRVLTPINVDTRTLEIKARAGALRTNHQEMTEAAIADITPRLNREALEQAPNVRNAARKTIAAFVKNWLLNSNGWGGQKLNAIQVVFPGETGAETDFLIPGFHELR